MPLIIFPKYLKILFRSFKPENRPLELHFLPWLSATFNQLSHIVFFLSIPPSKLTFSKSFYSSNGTHHWRHLHLLCSHAAHSFTFLSIYLYVVGSSNDYICILEALFLAFVVGLYGLRLHGIHPTFLLCASRQDFCEPSCSDFFFLFCCLTAWKVLYQEERDSSSSTPQPLPTRSQSFFFHGHFLLWIPCYRWPKPVISSRIFSTCLRQNSVLQFHSRFCMRAAPYKVLLRFLLWILVEKKLSVIWRKSKRWWQKKDTPILDDMYHNLTTVRISIYTTSYVLYFSSVRYLSFSFRKVQEVMSITPRMENVEFTTTS